MLTEQLRTRVQTERQAHYSDHVKSLNVKKTLRFVPDVTVYTLVQLNSFSGTG